MSPARVALAADSPLVSCRSSQVFQPTLILEAKRSGDQGEKILITLSTVSGWGHPEKYGTVIGLFSTAVSAEGNCSITLTGLPDEQIGNLDLNILLSKKNFQSERLQNLLSHLNYSVQVDSESPSGNSEMRCDLESTIQVDSECTYVKLSSQLPNS